MDALNAWNQRADAFLQRYPEVFGQDPGDIAPMEREANQLIDEWKALPRNAADVATYDLLIQIGMKASAVFFRYQTHVQRVIQARPPPGREPLPMFRGPAVNGNFLARAPAVNQGFANLPAQDLGQGLFVQPVAVPAKPFIPTGGRRKKTLRRRRRSSRR